MIGMSHTTHNFRVLKVAGITGTSAAFIDLSLLLVMLLLAALEASKKQGPIETSMEITRAESGQAASETPALVSLEIFSNGVVIDRDGDRIPFDRLGSELSGRGDGEGAVAVCVSAGVGYHDVRNVLAGVQKVLGPRTWIDCGGAP